MNHLPGKNTVHIHPKNVSKVLLVLKQILNLVGQHRPYGLFPYLSVQLRLFPLFTDKPRRGGVFHYRSVLQLPIAGVSFYPYSPYLFTSDKVATS